MAWPKGVPRKPKGLDSEAAMAMARASDEMHISEFHEPSVDEQHYELARGGLISPPWAPTRIVLERAVPVDGANLAGNIRIGSVQPPDPRTPIQERTWWVKSIEPDQAGSYVRVTGHDGSVKKLSPSVVAWLE
jgi:hypothetical protein